MDEDDDFDISDPVEGANANNAFQDLDDLDDDLFGSTLKKKLTSKLSAQPSKSILSPKHKPKIADEFNEDDPLAGLLSDEDDDEKPKASPAHKGLLPSTSSRGSKDTASIDMPQNKKADLDKKDQYVPKQDKIQSKITFDDDLDVLGNLGLTDASQNKITPKEKPSVSKKESSFMSSLLGNKTEDKQEKQKKSEFVLDEKYKTKPQEKDDYLFGTYSPSVTTTGDKGTPRRTSIGLEDKAKSAGSIRRKPEDKTKSENWLSFAKEDDSPVRITQRRKSNSADWLGKDENASNLGSGRRRQTDRLELDKEAPKKNENKSDWLDFGDQKRGKDKDITNIFGQSTAKSEKRISENDSSDWLQQKLQEKAKQEKSQMSFVNNDVESKPEQNTTPIKSEITTNVQNVPDDSVKQPQTTIVAHESQPQPTVVQQPQVTLPPAPTVMPQIQTEMIEQIGKLQSMVTKLQMEKDHLSQTIENLQKRHQEELETAEMINRQQLQTMDKETYQKQQRMKEDYEEKIAKQERTIDEIKQEKTEILRIRKDKTETTDLEHRKEIERMKELHDRAITAMKEEHEEALVRLKGLKDQEVEAISSTQTYARTIQNLVDQLENRTSELKTLQQTVEGRHQDALHERKVLLETKEKDLRSREQRLLRQREEEEEERVRLQQLVLRLETRLQMQTKETEENRWEFQQDKVRLEVQQKSLVAERRQLEEQVDLERLQLKRSKDSLLQEQQRLYTEIAQQRQQLTAERSQFEAQMRQWLQQDTERLTKKLKEKANLAAEKQFLQEEKKQIEFKQQQLEEELKKLHLDRLSVERDQQMMKTEQDTNNKLISELQKRSKEIEDMYRSAVREKEEGKLAHQKARGIETEANNKMSGLSVYLETIKEKEKDLLQQKRALEEEKNLLQTKKAVLLCANCRLSIGRSFPAIYTRTYFPNSGNIVQHPNILTNSSQDPNMLIWEINAEKDKEFLEVEGAFLESLGGAK